MVTEITAEPHEALVDVPVRIRVTGLEKNKSYTIHGRLVHNESLYLSSYAHYVAGTDGCIDVWNDAAIAGTYTGVDPMGLFWSMVAAPGQPRGVRLTKRYASTPHVFEFSVLVGHQSWESIHDLSCGTIAQTRVLRWYIGRGVKRIVIADGGVYGTLFIPPGDGPFIGILEVPGGAGGIYDIYSAFIASHGFVVFSLAYYDHKDLPDSMAKQDFSYFEKAVAWFSKCPEIHSGGVGVFGWSLGGEFAVLLGAYCKEVLAVVCFDSPLVLQVNMKWNGKRHFRGSLLHSERVKIVDDLAVIRGAFIIEDGKTGWSHLSRNIKFLQLIGDEDGVGNVEQFEASLQTMPPQYKHNVETIIYPKTGHNIEPYYIPHKKIAYAPAFKHIMDWGGSAKEHTC